MEMLFLGSELVQKSPDVYYALRFGGAVFFLRKIHLPPFHLEGLREVGVNYMVVGMEHDRIGSCAAMVSTSRT